jgi:hypothetical protein
MWSPQIWQTFRIIIRFLDLWGSFRLSMRWVGLSNRVSDFEWWIVWWYICAFRRPYQTVLEIWWQIWTGMGGDFGRIAKRTMMIMSLITNANRMNSYFVSYATSNLHAGKGINLQIESKSTEAVRYQREDVFLPRRTRWFGGSYVGQPLLSGESFTIIWNAAQESIVAAWMSLAFFPLNKACCVYFCHCAETMECDRRCEPGRLRL